MRDKAAHGVKSGTMKYVPEGDRYTPIFSLFFFPDDIARSDTVRVGAAASAAFHEQSNVPLKDAVDLHFLQC